MTNELSQHGIGIIGLQNIHNSNVNVTQILGKSLEYKDLMNRLQTQQKLFARTPEEETQERLEISQEIARLTAQIEQFKADVTRLAQEFNRIEINTDRLRRAKAHFEEGEMAAARAVFDSEREQMQDENNRLVREKDRYEQDVLPKLKHNSEEFYMRALLERTAYDNPNWLADTCEYFERSISAMATEDNVIQYAIFLQNHNFLDRATLWYQKHLDEFVCDDLAKRAMTLNNLAALHKAKHELAKAESEYAKALEILGKLAEINSSTYLPDLAMTLNNLGVLHVEGGKLTEAEKEYTEALAIYQKLADVKANTYLSWVATVRNNLGVLHNKNKELAKAESQYTEALKIYSELAQTELTAYLPDEVMTLNNLANLHSEKKELAVAESEYIEALEIYRQLAAVNPAVYLFYVAGTLNNLANLHKAKGELAAAKLAYTESLEIIRTLAAVNPAIYLPDLAMTLMNVAIYYLQSTPNRDRSISYSIETIILLRPIYKTVPCTQEYLQSAMWVLRHWGLSFEDIKHMLTDASTSVD